MTDNPFTANQPAFIRAQKSIAQKSTAYRAAVAAGAIDADGNPIEPSIDGTPQYDGHGRRIG